MTKKILFYSGLMCALALRANATETDIAGQTSVSGGVLSADGQSIIMQESDGMGGFFNVSIPISQITGNSNVSNVSVSGNITDDSWPELTNSSTPTQIIATSAIATQAAATQIESATSSGVSTAIPTSSLNTSSTGTTSDGLLNSNVLSSNNSSSTGVSTGASYTRKSDAWAMKLRSYGTVVSMNSSMVVTTGGTPALPLIAPPSGTLIQNCTSYSVLADGSIDWNNPSTNYIWFDSKTQVTTTVFGNAYSMTTIFTDGAGNTQKTISLSGLNGQTKSTVTTQTLANGSGSSSSSSSSFSSSSGSSNESSNSSTSGTDSSTDSSASTTTGSSSDTSGNNSSTTTGDSSDGSDASDASDSGDGAGDGTSETTVTTTTTTKKARRFRLFKRSF